MTITLKQSTQISIILILLLAATGCADTMTFEQAMHAEKVGFWYGLWHGLIFPFSWIISLLMDSVSVYAIYNNGEFYDCGFFLGAGWSFACIFHTATEAG